MPTVPPVPYNAPIADPQGILSNVWAAFFRQVVVALGIEAISLPVSVVNGGTGNATLTANAALIGNGTGGVTGVSPGAASNVLTSSGTAWTSSAPTGVGVYANFASLPGSPTDGMSAITKDTDTLYIYNLGTTTWLKVANGSTLLGIGTANGLSASGQLISLATASGSTTGALSSADWTTFNGKQAALTTGNLTDAGTDGITVTGGTGAVIGSGTSIAQHVADTTHSGYLSSTDWNTFNGKQASGNYITALTGDVTAAGPGSVAATIASNAVTNAKAAQMAAHTYKGNNTAGTANALDLTQAQLTAELNQFTSSLQGVVPSSGGGTANYLRADGTWVTPPGTGVTAVSVVSANGLAGTSSGGATPALTLTTSINGVLKGNGTAISAATSGTDYSAGTSGLATGIIKSTTTTGALTIAVAGDFPTLNQNTSGTAAGLSATLAIGSGGTNVTSVTTAPAATAFAGWDANKNLSANNFIEGYATTATAAGTTTLVVGSAWQQVFTGTTTQTVKLPVASTLVLGQQFQIVNNSSGVVTVQSSGANTIQAMAANTQLTVSCILASGTGTASWNWSYSALASALPMTNPMTTGGDVIYGGASGVPTRLANGTSGQVLTSQGTTVAPQWQAAAGGVPTLTPLTKTANYTITSSDSNLIADPAASAAFAFTMPAASTVSGRMYAIANNTKYPITLTPNGSDTVMLASSQVLQPGATTLLISDGSANFNAF